jgi:hypothetical protein
MQGVSSSAAVATASPQRPGWLPAGATPMAPARTSLRG